MNANGFALQRSVVGLLFLSTCFVCVEVQAHPDIEVQIARITAQLKQQPSSWQLYLQRAELHRTHGDWTNATPDYDAALRLNPHAFGVHLGRGQMLHEIGRLEEALEELNQYIEVIPYDSRGYAARGRLLRSLSRNAEAAADFNQAISKSTQPNMADYLDRARALAACGTNRLDEAVQGLDEAPNQLRTSLVIQDLALGLEVKAQRFDRALSRLDRHFANLPRKEWWRARRAEILVASGQDREALFEYQEALKHLSMLNPHVRGTRATQELETKVRAAIARAEALNGKSQDLLQLNPNQSLLTTKPTSERSQK